MRKRLGIVFGCLMMACGSSAEAPATTTAPPTTIAPSIAGATTTAAAPAIAEADVRALVAAWVVAQNTADFAAYDALYATRFDGIRRAGPRERRFDRAGWMADRRNMFSRPMHVAASEVTVSAAGGIATVSLVQSFTDGTFHDEGPKQMTIVREAGGLRIAREEMLASTLGDAAPASAFATGALMPIVSAGGRRFAVIAPVPADAEWYRGAPHLLNPDDVVVTRADVSAEAVPAALAAVANQAAVLFDAHAARCDVTLGTLSVLSRVDVHFGVEATWTGQNEDGTQGAPWTPAEIASNAFGEGQLLVATIPGNACSDASFARLSALPPSAAFASSAADAALATRVLAAFRALDVWTTMQASYTESGGTDAHWDEIGGAAPSVTVWAVPNATRRFAVIGVSAGDGGCGDFSASVWSVFEVAADGSLTRLTDASDPGYFAPLGAIDVDGDGRPEWVAEQGLVGAVGSGLGLVMDISWPIYDCYC